MLFYGYRLKGKTIKEIQAELEPVRAKIQNIADEVYHSLIGKEAAFLGDCLTLNIIERDFNENYIQNAVSNVNYWIRNYNIKHFFGEYNFTLYTYLFEYKNHVYIRVDFKNLIFKEAFDNFDDISISKMDYEMNMGFLSDFWHYATESVKKNEPVSINLSPNLDFKMKKLKFPSKEIRINEWSRHQELNRLIDSMRFDQNPIAPARLMSFLDLAYQTFMDKEKIDAETGIMLAEKTNLKNVLLDFNEHKDILLPKKEEKNENTETDI